MRVAGIRRTSLFDGDGINYVIFVQGCAHHCPHCHNTGTWDFNGGHELSLEELKNDISKYIGFIHGVTFSGGDPVYQMEEVSELAAWVKQAGLTTTLYTGFTMSELEQDRVDLSNIDIVIDGLYQHENHTTELPFRGSSNQRIYCKIICEELTDQWVEVDIMEDKEWF